MITSQAQKADEWAKENPHQRPAGTGDNQIKPNCAITHLGRYKRTACTNVCTITENTEIEPAIYTD